MDKTFDPAAIETRIRKAWEDAEAFRAGRPERVKAAPYSIVIPPPNVTGSLHMGHALNNTLQDILVRYHRMKGEDVLWQPGTDHAGIATQMVVERQLMERQEHRRTMGREKFVERVWEWKAESGGKIVEQLKRLGASCDWSRERFTLDEGLSRAVAKVFVQLYRDGLLYKDKRLVNWDPVLQTAISDLEVVQQECRGSFKWERGGEAPFDAAALGKVLDKNPNGHLYYFNYPLDGEEYDPENPYTFIQVATTRPETMVGDTGVAVHPKNEKLSHLIGRKAILPIVGRHISIVGDDYADPEKGTGAVKITPAHDFNDFEVGKRHGLAAINVLDHEANIQLDYDDAFFEGLEERPAVPDTAFLLDGLDRFTARRMVVELMAERGFLHRIEPHTHMVPHGDRSHAVLEPRLTDQWYVDAKTLAQPALKAVRDGRTTFVPKNWEKTYFDWLENIQPWCVSRQLWWGHRIPAWYGPTIELGVPQLNGPVYEIFVAETEEEAIAQAWKRYAELGYDCFVGVANDVWDAASVMSTQDERPKVVSIWRDEDVLDTWFSSALWPFSTLGWPDETPELSRFYPTNVLVTGFDIIFFWVARMMMMGLHFRKEIPFRDVYIHALVRDEKGAKMSKSKGNVIDPLALIGTYGADALRFTLAAMAAQGRDIKLSAQRIEGYRNFGTKLWNAARFAGMNGCVLDPAFDPRQTEITLNSWIVGEAAKTVAEVTSAIEAYRFNEAAGAAYRFVWNIFCDWYLELAKPLLQGADGPAKEETRAATAFVREQILKLLHPFMPFITEELWAITASPHRPRASLLALAGWPDLKGCENPAAEAEIGFIVELISEIRSVRAEMNVPPAAQIPLVLVNASAGVRAYVKTWDETVRRLARLSEITFSGAAPPKSAQTVVRQTVAALPLHGFVDIESEKTRLAKEIAKLKGESSKIEAKLNNRDFVARAPEEIVEENRERLAEALSKQEKLAAALERLQGA
jgi:valyl-tRNA synthetase